MDVQVLVQRAQANDRAAFGELYELFHRKIYRYIAYQVNGCPETAEDLTEDVFMKALQSLGRYQLQEVPFSAWLYRIAHNCVIDYFRAPKNQPAIVLDDIEHLLAVEDRTKGRLDRYTLSGALAKITADQRQIVLMRIVQGLTIRETAQAAGKSEDSVKQTQSRGLKALKRILASGLTARTPECSARPATAA